MIHFITTIFLSAFLLCAMFLDSQIAVGSNASSRISQARTATIADSKRDTDKLYKFLDFYHDGTKESFLRGIKKSKVLILRENQNSNENSAKVVNVLGADWGLSIRTNPYGKITEVVLITSNTSQKIFTRAKTELNPYLGKPSEIDSDERIKWDTQNLFAQFRHLHSDEGGWTIIFKFYYSPKFDTED